jgi:hypothetical protein
MRLMRFVPNLIQGYAVTDRFVERLRLGARNVLQAYLANVMTPEEMTSLTVVLYRSWFSPKRDSAGLFDWEREWISYWLPTPPARILVGAAGTGREVGYLLEAGYLVDAFEPVDHAYRTCVATVAGRGRVFQSTYGDFVRGEECGELEFGRYLRGVRYDAILLGWGSLSHVFGLDERRRLLQSCVRIAPEGPILASFHTRPECASGGVVGAGLAERLGRALGELHASSRGVTIVPEPVQFWSHLGVTYAFTSSEIEELGANVGRKVSWEGVQLYPHAVFVPSA